jgi:hypothetical protein
MCKYGAEYNGYQADEPRGAIAQISLATAAHPNIIAVHAVLIPATVTGTAFSITLGTAYSVQRTYFTVKYCMEQGLGMFAV